jgi:hypothetical protein
MIIKWLYFKYLVTFNKIILRVQILLPEMMDVS